MTEIVWHILNIYVFIEQYHVIWYMIIKLPNEHAVPYLDLQHGSSTRCPPGCIKRPAAAFFNYCYYYYLFITCNWVDTRWQQSLHVTLARPMKILL